MARRGEKLLLVAAALLLGLSGAAAQTPPDRVDTIRDVFVRLRSCWRPPPPAKARPIDITVVVSFNRSGDILGHPRITYESAEASDNDRLQYRIAVMEALQRCTPMPFTDAMAGAAAGRPFAVQFRNRKTSPPTQERRA
ncbi:hypothetical protein AYJ54_34300 [Bradyrhizobium centrolobii]|uniref:TonB C-terminal domain-containing protein n=1 Tax=Bradyrhizobium centrolobii TaxID=1505087 RepID=A0A176YAC8_9BRAD|nr:hypothetical protein [Bradyrhizobium centrolobii]OAE98620.1 hypothetical protein AYJ54_34300 [Bradyrhizobium centrolobii]